MSELFNSKQIENVEHKNSFDTQLSDHQIRKIKDESKYRPEYVELLECHLQDNSFPSFAGVIKVNSTTLYLWIKKYPEFAAVHKKYKRKKTKIYS